MISFKSTDLSVLFLFMKIFILDGYNLIFRSFYGMPDLKRGDGFPTGMLHGWVRTLWSLEDQFSPDRIVCAMDAGADEREALQEDYKANRSETPAELEQQPGCPMLPASARVCQCVFPARMVASLHPIHI